MKVVTVTLNPAIDRTVVIPQFQAGKVNRVTTVRSNPGGKGVNVAAALADHQIHTAVTGFLGRENTASFEQMFAEKHITDRFIRIAGQTRVGIKISDPIQQETTDINFPGPTPSEADLASLHKTIAELDAPWFVLAGSLPPGVPETIYRDIIATLKSAGKQSVLDASGEALREAIKAIPTIIKPNIHELEDLLGHALPTEKDIVQAARQLLETGIELVVISMGERGACFVSPTETVIATPPAVEVRSTVGAGDAMVAGILAGHLRGLSLSDIARLATASSVHAISGLPLAEAQAQVTLRETRPAPGKTRQAPEETRPALRGARAPSPAVFGALAENIPPAGDSHTSKK